MLQWRDRDTCEMKEEEETLRVKQSSRNEGKEKTVGELTQAEELCESRMETYQLAGSF